jgi:hypothetical protein
MDSTLSSAALAVGAGACPTPFSLLFEEQMSAKSKIKEMYNSCFSIWSLFLRAHPFDFFVESK